MSQPTGWKGWPDGKKFAVVLTHDVEGLQGVAKCRALLQLELSLGFRSSFNFIPEGEYPFPAELRQELLEAGFEIGVHDLRHDGKLFRSRKVFAENARRINKYLAAWGAVGFRAGFMLRKLEWYHDLDILYEASTFDTDPFEPQSEGARTIFPFWIDRPSPPPTTATQSPKGYVELPYTLPQDSTLFLVLGETSPRIWIEKMHRIASQGGMVLLNVHPDYIRHSPSDSDKLLFPASYYADFLRAINDHYAGKFWNPLPKDLALWYKEQDQKQRTATPPETNQATLKARGALRTKRAAVVLYSSFPEDPRPRRAAEALIQEGMEVDFFCLGDKASPPGGEMLHGVRVFRHVMSHERDNKLRYILKYGRFLLAAFWFLTKRSLRRRYDIVHIHNMPDVLVFSALLPKLRGAKLILDLHDPMPELMMTIFHGNETSRIVAILKWLEKLSIGFVDRAITVNIACKRIFSNRSCPAEKVAVIMNSPDEAVFAFRDIDSLPMKKYAQDTPFVIMYHGSLVERHGLDLAVAALAKIQNEIPLAELRIYGSHTPYLSKVLESITDPNLKKAVCYLGAKPLDAIVEAIGECDVGVIPNRRSIFTELNTPTRIFEYLSQGKPVISPEAAGILDYFGPEDLIYFELGNCEALAEKMRFVYQNPERVQEIVRRGQQVLREHTWSSERNLFLNTVIDVISDGTKVLRTPEHIAKVAEGTK